MPPIEMKPIDRELYTLGLGCRCYGDELPPKIPVCQHSTDVHGSFEILIQDVERRFTLEDILSRLKELGFVAAYDAAQITFEAFVSVLKKFTDVWETPAPAGEEDEINAF